MAAIHKKIHKKTDKKIYKKIYKNFRYNLASRDKRDKKNKRSEGCKRSERNEKSEKNKWFDFVSISASIFTSVSVFMPIFISIFVPIGLAFLGIFCTTSAFAATGDLLDGALTDIKANFGLSSVFIKVLYLIEIYYGWRKYRETNNPLAVGSIVLVAMALTYAIGKWVGK